MVKSKQAGVDGLLTLDLPPEERANYWLLAETGDGQCDIIAPTTPEERISKIASKASGFLYYVSVRESRENGSGWNLSERVGFVKKQIFLCGWLEFPLRRGVGGCEGGGWSGCGKCFG